MILSRELPEWKSVQTSIRSHHQLQPDHQNGKLFFIVGAAVDRCTGCDVSWVLVAHTSLLNHVNNYSDKYTNFQCKSDTTGALQVNRKFIDRSSFTTVNGLELGFVLG